MREQANGGGRRLALLVTVTQYHDEGLRELRAPAGDAAALSDVLGDPEIGAFSVTSVVDAEAKQVRIAVDEFLSGLSADDLAVVYLSCHGLVDLRRRLYFAAADTRKDRLSATAVEAHWLLDRLEECRARRQVVILDCCFSGAFARGAKGTEDLALGDRLLGEGRGRVVLTASRGTEYSFEGTPFGGSTMSGSVFTNALVSGIRSGAADLDHDGYISVDDAYTYAFDEMRSAGAQQTPQRWLYGAEGSIVLARNPAAEPGLAPPGPDAVAATASSSARSGTPAAPTEPATASVARRRVVGGAALAILTIVAVTVAVVLAISRPSGREPAGDTTGTGDTFGSESDDPLVQNETFDGPWRIVVDNNLAAGNAGCSTEVRDEDGDMLDLDLLETFGRFQRQVPQTGTFRIESSHADCLVLLEDGFGKLPRQFPILYGAGDTDAFNVASAQRVIVDKVEASSCYAILYDAETGDPLAQSDASTTSKRLVMSPRDSTWAYLRLNGCQGVEVSVE